MQTLDTYKSFGPPSIRKSLMTLEDEKFAKEHKEWELGRVGEDLFDEVDEKVILSESEETSMEEADEIPFDDLGSVN